MGEFPGQELLGGEGVAGFGGVGFATGEVVFAHGGIEVTLVQLLEKLGVGAGQAAELPVEGDDAVGQELLFGGRRMRRPYGLGEEGGEEGGGEGVVVLLGFAGEDGGGGGEAVGEGVAADFGFAFGGAGAGGLLGVAAVGFDLCLAGHVIPRGLE